MGKTALIVAGGRKPGKSLLYQYRLKADIVIGADKGAECLIANDMDIFAVVGDFDSIDKDAVKWLKSKSVRLEKVSDKKDETDTMLAVQLAINSGADIIYILGALGKRLDHQFANIAILMYARKNGAEAVLVDEHNHVMLSKPEQSFDASVGDFFSLFSLTKKTEFYSSSGLKYPLNGLVLRRDTPIGVSNQAMTKHINITVKRGQALIIHSYE